MDRERLLLEMKRSWGAMLALVALIVVALGCVAVILANIGISLPWQSTYSRQVAVDTAKGVVTGDSVRLAGVDVGRISAVRLTPSGPVLDITMDPAYGPLYNNATLNLRPETPLDDMYLDIVSRGTPSAGALAADRVLPAQRTQTPVDISSVLDVFNADTRSRVREAIDTLGASLGSQGRAFDAALVQLAPFLSAARQLTLATAQRAQVTRTLIHNFGLITRALAQRDTQLRQLVASGAATLSELGANAGAVQGLVNALPDTMAQLQSAFATVRATEDHLDPAFTALEPVAATLPSALDALTRFSGAATPALRRLDHPLPVLNDLMHALSPAATHLDASLHALVRAPGQLSDLTRLVIPCEPALADFFQNTLSVGKYSTSLATIIRGEAVTGVSSYNGTVNDQVQPASCAPGNPK
ncbi:MAG TPA: MlaD family protein [Solirubrobacteraceae bacterium]|nr:MlaD family protein [Solirubrobacteraceae bacterium]